MQDVFVYLDGWKWPLNPASIQFRLPTHSATYELVGAGEAEILQGAKLADIQLKGFLPRMERHYAQEEPIASEFVEKIRAMVEESKPVRFVYTGKAWDLNFLVSVQSPVFREQGGSFDLDYEVSLRKWVEVGPELLVNGSGRSRRIGTATTNDAGKKNEQSSYTVQANDTLSRIARYALGDASRWKEIYELNRDMISNPNLIWPGMKIQLPAGANSNIPKGSSTKNGGSSTKQKSKKSSSSNSKSDTYGVENDAQGNGKLMGGATVVPDFNSADGWMGGYGKRKTSKASGSWTLGSPYWP